MAADKLTAEAVAEQLARLREDYQARLPAELAALTALAAGFGGAESDRARLEELHQRLHKLAGSGGTFGLASLSARARALEQQSRQWLAGTLNEVAAEARQAFVGDVARLGEAASGVTDAPSPRAQAARPAPTPPGKIANIWLIEDDPETAEQLVRQLESFGYAVRHFTRVRDAEAAAQTRRPDMLISDIMFPQEGEDATQVLTERPALRMLGCPLLFISSNDDFPSRARAARIGAEGYFLKPLDVPRLVNRMTQIFDQRRAPPQRVLIVDDDVPLAAHYRLALIAAGMEAEVLHEPRNIIETVAAVRPELVLMDLHMPEYSGPELAGVIRQYERWTSLPIVYLSAETDLDRQIEALGQGADDFLTKPISDAHLVAAVRARVDRARQLDAQISRDSLTGLLKHASIKESVEVEVARMRRLGKPLSVAMLDIDHFKLVNDTYGHAVGDVVISAIAMLLRQRLRQTDIVGRYGGEEFLAVLPECDAHNAQQLLEDIRRRFAALVFSHQGQTFSCTLSAGLASSTYDPKAGKEEQLAQLFHDSELLVAADSALYSAKNAGRNQVRMDTASAPETARR